MQFANFCDSGGIQHAQGFEEMLFLLQEEKLIKGFTNDLTFDIGF